MMKKHIFLTLAVLPMLGLVSCSDKAEEAAPAPAAKVLNTADDYAAEMLTMRTALADLLTSITPENSAAKAAEVKALMQKGEELMKEVEAKQIEMSDEVMAKYEEKLSAEESRLVEQIMRLVGMKDQLDAELMKVLEQ